MSIHIETAENLQYIANHLRRNNYCIIILHLISATNGLEAPLDLTGSKAKGN